MDPEKQRLWREADALLDRLLDLPPAQREQAFARLPAALQPLVGRLLRADRASGPLDEPLEEAIAASTAAPPAAPQVPRRIGPWTLAGEIGRGGMAVVHRAERELGGGTVQVAALKLLTVGALAADGRRRFLREHEVLARLAHPHIAALLDAGVLADGTPYLAMQLVEGERIDRWCRQRRLGPRAIVQLFLQVCEAVAYAHRQLVVHRDLKPANILVDGDGHVRLLDFGIARLLDQAAEDEATRTQFRALTPQYAAPEQFAGLDSGTAADVFGLGAVLYHLLAGRPPRLPAQGHDSQITQPSRVAAQAEALDAGQRGLFARTLRGDLDAILLRALDADPQHRYPDAAALADDLRRWLGQRPVQAARAGTAYRLRKFAVRHRGGVAAALLITAAVLAGVVGTLWQARRAELAAAEAVAEAERANRVKDFLVALFEASDLERADGRARDAVQMLELGAERARHGGALEEPTRVELLTVIAEAQRSHARHDDAAANLDSAIELARSNPAVPPLLLSEAIHQRGNLLFVKGGFDQAVAQFDTVIERTAQPRSEAELDLRTRALTQRGMVYGYLERIEDARADFAESERLIATREPPPALRLAELRAAQGTVEYTDGRHDRAYRYLQEELALRRSRNVDGNNRLAQTLSNLSAIAGMLGRLDEALAYDTESVALARELFPPGHPAIGDSLYGLGDTQRQLGLFDDSVASLTEAISLLQKGDRVRHAQTAQMSLGRTRLARGEYEQARALVEEIHAAMDERYGGASTMALRLRSMLGEALQHLGDDAALARWHEETLRRLEQISEEVRWHPNAQDLRWRLALVHAVGGDWPAAQRWLDQARQAPATDGMPPAAMLRIRALALSAALEQGAADLRQPLEQLAGDLRGAQQRSRETRAYGWAHVGRAARRIGADALADEARDHLRALVGGNPLPHEDGVLARETLALLDGRDTAR